MSINSISSSSSLTDPRVDGVLTQMRLMMDNTIVSDREIQQLKRNEQRSLQTARIAATKIANLEEMRLVDSKKISDLQERKAEVLRSTLKVCHENSLEGAQIGFHVGFCVGSAGGMLVGAAGGAGAGVAIGSPGGAPGMILGGFLGGFLGSLAGTGAGAAFGSLGGELIGYEIGNEVGHRNIRNQIEELESEIQSEEENIVSVHFSPLIEADDPLYREDEEISYKDTSEEIQVENFNFNEEINPENIMIQTI